MNRTKAFESPPPDFGRLRQALLRQGEPDRVPLFEGNIDPSIKQAFLRHPIRTLSDEVLFWEKAGYDYVPIPTGVRLLVRARTTPTGGVSGRELIAAGSTSGAASTVRAWAHEGTGVITDWASLERFRWPNIEDFDLCPFEALSTDLPKGMKVIPMMGYIFAASWMLMGFENFCLALIDQPDLVAAVFERVGTLQLDLLRHLLDHYSCIGAFFHPDDVAYKEGLIVAPQHLRKHIFPWYSEMVRLCHARGLPVIYHSDGRLDAILDDIVECGFDALHPLEPKAMDIVALKHQPGFHVCLLGGLDLGHILTRGTPAEVSAEVKRLLREVAPGGGYALGSSNSVTDYVPFPNYQAMRQTALALGRYPIAI